MFMPVMFRDFMPFLSRGGLGLNWHVSDYPIHIIPVSGKSAMALKSRQDAACGATDCQTVAVRMGV